MKNQSEGVVRRLRRPSWRDGRLIIGLILVLASVAVGARVVAAANQTRPVYAAAGALVPGEHLTADRLKRVDVALGQSDSTYLSADGAPPADSVIVREVRAGELVPAAALADTDTAKRTKVMVSVSSDSAAVLAVGSIVDVWVNDKVNGTNSYGTPRQLVHGAPVSRVPSADSNRLSSSGTTGIQLQVPTDQVKNVIAAMDQGAKITLVPVSCSAERDK